MKGMTYWCHAYFHFSYTQRTGGNTFILAEDALERYHIRLDSHVRFKSCCLQPTRIINSRLGPCLPSTCQGLGFHDT